MYKIYFQKRFARDSDPSTCKFKTLFHTLIKGELFQDWQNYTRTGVSESTAFNFGQMKNTVDFVEEFRLPQPYVKACNTICNCRYRSTIQVYL